MKQSESWMPEIGTSSSMSGDDNGAFCRMAPNYRVRRRLYPSVSSLRRINSVAWKYSGHHAQHRVASQFGGFAVALITISLFLVENSLIRIWKFPVPLRREFRCKPLDPPVDQTRKPPWMAGF